MGTEIYTIDSREMKPWYELVPNKIKKVLENPGPHDRLLIFAETPSPDQLGRERDYLYAVSDKEFKDFYDFDPNDYYELDGKEFAAFFDTHFFSLYCYDIPNIDLSAKSVSSLYIRVAKFLSVIQASGRHFLICVSQEFGAHSMFLTNCSVAVSTPDETTQPAPQPQPKPLEWLTDEQYEILALRVELLKRDFWDWCDNESLDRPYELFENSEKFLTMCHNGTLLDSASTVDGYILLETLRQAVVSLQGFGYLCNCPTEAAKILGMLKPYLDAVYDLPKPVKGDSNNE